MIAWLARILIARNPVMTLAYARRLVTIALVVIGVLVAGIGGCVAKRAYDRSVVEDARQTDNAEAAAGAAKADANAADRRLDDAVRSEVERRELEEVTNVPNVNDARRAYYRCVRLQQQAREAGRPAPACE